MVFVVKKLALIKMNIVKTDLGSIRRFTFLVVA